MVYEAANALHTRATEVYEMARKLVELNQGHHD